MITPRFKLNQSEETITIIIRAPYSNLRELEVSIEENVFIFLSRPYYLRLHLPGSILENDNTKSSFNADSGEFTFTYGKSIRGEHFPDLDLITKLLCPKIEVNQSDRKIIILNSDSNESNFNDDGLNKQCGFAMMGKRNFNYISAEFQDVFEIDPRDVNLDERRKMRLQYEQGKFNIDHYISDFIEDDEIIEIINLKTPWSKFKLNEIEFNDRELDFMKDLLNIQYNLDELQTKYCHCCLIDILFAYCYDRRTTYFEGTSESGWTIIKLAASLCWLDGFIAPKEALVSSFRRSLIYPLYRNFQLCETVFNDLKQLIEFGEKFIIKCLIEMYDIFLTGDCCRYIINNLFIKDYITYIMKWDKMQWNEIVMIIKNIQIRKGDLGLNLMEIEGDLGNKLSKFSKLRIKNDDSDDTDSSRDNSDDCDTSTDSESSSSDSESSSSDSDSSYSVSSNHC